jgi:hypothetical protein
MAKAASDGFRRNEWVKNIYDLPRVPAGSRGRVYLVEGFTWTRYRVLFDNGVDIGSLDGAVLARPRDFASALERREQAAIAAEAAASQAETVAEEGAAPAGEDNKTVNGVPVPAHLLDRSRRARERLAAA